MYIKTIKNEGNYIHLNIIIYYKEHVHSSLNEERMDIHFLFLQLVIVAVQGRPMWHLSNFT